MGLIIDYKRYTITQRIKLLEKSIKRFPDGPETPRRLAEVEMLKKDLMSLDET